VTGRELFFIMDVHSFLLALSTGKNAKNNMKKFALFTLAVFFGCQTQSPPQQSPLELTKDLFQAFNAHDWEAMIEFYADSFVYESPGIRFNTREQVLRYYREMNQVFPDIQDSVVNYYPSGNSVVVEFVARGTAADGTKLDLPILGVLTFENGKIVRDATYYDN